MNRAFYKYNFVSPDSIFAEIQEELRSYFSTGAIDPIMFGTWTNQCLRKLGYGSYPITSEILEIDDFIAKLPENFIKAREVWACAPSREVIYKEPSSTYTEISTKLSDSSETRCEPSCEFPDVINVIYKTNRQQKHSFNKTWLLRPGNLSVKQYCSEDCFNFSSTCEETFDIHGNKLVTSFRTGHIYLLYYSSDVDDCGNQLIPDNYRIQEYIKAFIKYKLFEQISNQTTDETFNQINQKMIFYKQASDEAYIMMDIESKKKTDYQKFDSINQTIRRNRKYIIR